jgi:nucleotide-binding universal stress UspA family protein
MYRKLLVPTDGSVLATKAINHAIGLGKETGATLTIVTVTDMWSPWEMARNARSRHTAPVEDYEEKATANARMVLEDARRLVEGEGLKVETVHIPDRQTAAGIVETAKQRDCDLIVIATHGRRGIEHLVMGSDTTEVLHLSPVPVLVVR